jgi:uncharacterized membrane protein YdbT with pleckstrin-like domain
MSYVSKILQPGETLRYDGTVHWSVYIPAMFAFLLGLVGVAIIADEGNFSSPNIIGLILAGYGVLVTPVTFVRAWLKRLSTEIAVTDRRVIIKRGLVSRVTAEMNMAKVESVDVVQSVMGRMLGYGDVIVRGTGSSFEPIVKIADPIAFRNSVTAA